MFFSSSTAGVERGRGAAVARPAGPLGRLRTTITAALLLAWLALMSLGVMSLCRPPWLERLGRRGVEAESRAYLRYGDSLVRQREYRLAVAQYAYSLRIKPNVPAVMTNLAVALIHLGDPQRAADILRQVEQMDLRPRLRSTVYVNLTLVAERQQNMEQAIGYCQRALENAAEPDKVYRKLGTLYTATGRFSEARAALEQALAAQLDLTLPYRKMLAHTAEDNTADPRLAADVEQRLGAGVRVEDLRFYDLDLLREAQNRDPEISRTHGLLGAVCAQLHDHAAARQHLEDALRIWPDNRDARQNLDRLRRVAPRP